MSDHRPVSGPVPGVRRGFRGHRLRPVFHSMRRHVDFCRTATAICRA